MPRQTLHFRTASKRNMQDDFQLGISPGVKTFGCMWLLYTNIPSGVSYAPHDQAGKAEPAWASGTSLDGGGGGGGGGGFDRTHRPPPAYGPDTYCACVMYYIFERSRIDRPSTWMGLTISGPKQLSKNDSSFVSRVILIVQYPLHIICLCK